jgi:hypothetical protein
MKKCFVFVAALAALVACSKNELVPSVNEIESEITFNVAPQVKADDFNTSWNFYSTAYYLDNTKTWAANSSASSSYINNSLIEWDNTSSVWRNKTTKYYWPKDGKLTFFAWTCLSESSDNIENAWQVGNANYGKSEFEVATPNATVSVNNTDGVKVAGYSVLDNFNYDLLVADIKAEQTKNSSSVYFREGVPTLFRHKLSNVLFTVKTDKDYAASGISFAVNSITFKGLDHKGTYTQGVDASSCLGSWTNTTDVADQAYFEGVASFEVPNNTAALPIYAYGNQYYYLPQTFSTSDNFVVNYTIDYGNGVTETINQVCYLNPNATTGVFDKFEMGKKYTINLIFSLNEILWDPAVEDWSDATKDLTIL